jgi:peroxiredoxin
MRLRDLVIAVFVVSLLGAAAALWLSPAGLQAAPPVSVTTLQGEPLSLQSLRGRPVLVTFWATTCRGCIEEIPHLTELYREYAGSGLEIIGIAMAYDPPDRVIALSKSRGIPYPLALDIDSRAARAFGDVSQTPATFLIAPDGRVAHRQTGALDMQKVRGLVAGMLPGGDRLAVN